MEKATFLDYARMCNYFGDSACSNEHESCPLRGKRCAVLHHTKEKLEELNALILRWVKAHPVKTRQSEFLKQYPGAMIDKNDRILSIMPCLMEPEYEIYASVCDGECEKCRKEYWLEEIE